MGKKSVLFAVSIVFMFLFCAGCAKQGIDGYWVKTDCHYLRKLSLKVIQ